MIYSIEQKRFSPMRIKQLKIIRKNLSPFPFHPLLSSPRFLFSLLFLFYFFLFFYVLIRQNVFRRAHLYLGFTEGRPRKFRHGFRASAKCTRRVWSEAFD